MTSSSFFLNTYMCTCYYIIYRISPKRRHQTKDLNHTLASGAQGCGIVARIRQPVSFYFIVLLSLLVCGARIFISLLVYGLIAHSVIDTRLWSIFKLKVQLVYFISIFCVHHLSISI